MTASMRKTGIEQVMGRYKQQRRELESAPLRIVQEWRNETLEELGVEPGEEQQTVNILDIHKKIPWDTFKTLHRRYVMDLQILRLLPRGKPEVAAAQL